MTRTSVFCKQQKIEGSLLTTLITGAAGFIGAAVSAALLERGDRVVGVDNLNDYYSVRLKRDRLALLNPNQNFTSVELDISDKLALDKLFSDYSPTRVIHLAAQAGVRYSLHNPAAYISANLVAFANMLECCRTAKIVHLVFASSSSVYGANTKIPFSTADNVDHPLSLYAATKKSNELMAHSYSHLFGIPTTGLRFFTVYGPWGRPDMAYYSFAEKMIRGEPIEIFNHGNCRRDFTYIDDVVAGVLAVLDKPAQGNRSWDGTAPDPASSIAPYRIYNLGNNRPVELLNFVEILEALLGVHAQKIMLPAQPGDVPETYANIEDLKRDMGFKPTTSIDEGLEKFVTWFKAYHALTS
jgi:UDP-glucuronate 4-epimerase